MSGYSETLSKCYLTSTDELCVADIEILNLHLKLNCFSPKNNPIPFISKYWAPKTFDVKPGERAYFTQKMQIILIKLDII